MKVLTVAPRAVRATLGMRVDKELAYKIERSRAILTKASDGTTDDPFTNFGEWGSDSDNRAYRHL